MKPGPCGSSDVSSSSGGSVRLRLLAVGFDFEIRFVAVLVFVDDCETCVLLEGRAESVDDLILEEPRLVDWDCADVEALDDGTWDVEALDVEALADEASDVEASDVEALDRDVDDFGS
jgi:hypothetical protein